jgi:hypothetical protein
MLVGKVIGWFALAYVTAVLVHLFDGKLGAADPADSILPALVITMVVTLTALARRRTSGR